MAVQEIVQGVKVVLKFEKGSQTIGNCDLEATPEKLMALSEAVETLVRETVLDRQKISQVSLLNTEA
ncbi:MAG: hypothetical protein AB9856_14915 [Cellulosilyticaceae bacterium]